MATNITERTAAPPNRTTVRQKVTPLGVRRIQPNPEGGRPADSLIEGFEGSFEGLVILKDDEVLDRDWVQTLRFVLSTEQSLVRQIFAGVDHREVEKQVRACHRIIESLVVNIEEREKRLGVVEQDQQSVVTSLDAAITRRAHLELV